MIHHRYNALASGFCEMARDDYDNMARQFPAYDALYAFCKSGSDVTGDALARARRGFFPTCRTRRSASSGLVGEIQAAGGEAALLRVERIETMSDPT